mmetsp:Transcript_35765/g.88032  ORF Transcript_35765/g.88032 Transcript_35765/m.88032 type:complete len:236 (+) Transcript_35765:864-1571(+)
MNMKDQLRMERQGSMSGGAPFNSLTDLDVGACYAAINADALPRERRTSMSGERRSSLDMKCQLRAAAVVAVASPGRARGMSLERRNSMDMKDQLRMERQGSMTGLADMSLGSERCNSHMSGNGVGDPDMTAIYAAINSGQPITNTYVASNRNTFDYSSTGGGGTGGGERRSSCNSADMKSLLRMTRQGSVADMADAAESAGNTPRGDSMVPSRRSGDRRGSIDMKGLLRMDRGRA